MMVVNNNELTRARLEFRESESAYSVHHLREEEARDANRSRTILEVKGPFRKSKVRSRVRNFEYTVFGKEPPCMYCCQIKCEDWVST